MARCTFCGTEVPPSPSWYVEEPDHEKERTTLALACPGCASGFPTRFAVG